jgi:hypothetical protein
MQALFGNAYVEDLTRYSDGRFSARHVERPRVRVDEWMNALEPGAAWLRIAPIDRGWRQERVRVALPNVGNRIRKRVRKPRLPHDATSFRMAQWALPARVWKPCPAAVQAAKAGKAHYRRCRRIVRVSSSTKWAPTFSRRSSDAGQSNVTSSGRAWCGVTASRRSRPRPGCTGGSMMRRGRSDTALRVVWRRVYGVIKEGTTVDQLC